MCGGTSDNQDKLRIWGGLSPRVRGNPGWADATPVWTGSIPACAGEPRRAIILIRPAAVYPRVCGGTWAGLELSTDSYGLSPRVRGNRPQPRQLFDGCRSIPACAGEPCPTPTAPLPPPVYPRVCGGTLPYLRGYLPLRGLSPRVRGNRGGLRTMALQLGSIPACAGEPPMAHEFHLGCPVYPRVCGGTSSRRTHWEPVTGLSPRVRGNRGRRNRRERLRGSIPACAGEPTSGRSSGPFGSVYPRVCGGTYSSCFLLAAWRGLSPRVRGNLLQRGLKADHRGSIPACAGEPCATTPTNPRCAVYPRVCGGTAFPCPPRLEGSGLSPRVRGNRGQLVMVLPVSGSIPACAGEPLGPLQPAPAAPVYPRVCGGTSAVVDTRPCLSGLSPRVRGNLLTRRSVLCSPPRG